MLGLEFTCLARRGVSLVGSGPNTSAMSSAEAMSAMIDNQMNGSVGYDAVIVCTSTPQQVGAAHQCPVAAMRCCHLSVRNCRWSRRVGDRSPRDVAALKPIRSPTPLRRWAIRWRDSVARRGVCSENALRIDAGDGIEDGGGRRPSRWPSAGRTASRGSINRRDLEDDGGVSIVGCWRAGAGACSVGIVCAYTAATRYMRRAAVTVSGRGGPQAQGMRVPESTRRCKEGTAGRVGWAEPKYVRSSRTAKGWGWMNGSGDSSARREGKQGLVRLREAVVRAALPLNLLNASDEPRAVGAWAVVTGGTEAEGRRRRGGFVRDDE